MRELLTKRGRALDDILGRPRSPAGDAGMLRAAWASPASAWVANSHSIMSPKGFGASAPFYGTPLPRHLSETLDGACPIVASFGSRDPLGVGAPNKLREVTAAKNITADIKAYPGAGTASPTTFPPSPCFASRASATTRPRPKTPGAGSSRSSASIWRAGARRDRSLSSVADFSFCDKTRREGVGVAWPARRHVVAVVDDECRPRVGRRVAHHSGGLEPPCGDPRSTSQKSAGSFRARVTSDCTDM